METETKINNWNLIKLKNFRTASVLQSVVSNSLQSHGLSMEFSSQEYWDGLPFPSSGDLPNPGIEPEPPVLQADSSLGPPGKETIEKTKKQPTD